MLQQEVLHGGCSGGGGRCTASSPAFSLLFPSMPVGLPPEQCYYYRAEDGGPVDCTLSLATPSTRRAEANGVVHESSGGAVVLVEEPRQEEGSPPRRRRCANCDTTSTPLWRNGPRGPKSLCNACGIRYKKEERRAAAAVAPAPAATQQQQQQWGCYGPGAGKAAASYGMYGGDVGVVDADGPCLSWMLNVVPSSAAAFAVRERRTLFQYY